MSFFLLPVYLTFTVSLFAGCGPKKHKPESGTRATLAQPPQATNDEPGIDSTVVPKKADATDISRPFDPPRPDQQLPVPQPSIFPGWPGLPLPILSLNQGGIALDQLVSAAVTISPVVTMKIHDIIAAREERQRREDEIRAEIETKFNEDLTEYYEKRNKGQSPPYPVRRSFKRSEIEHLIDADHLIAAAEFEYSKVAADQVLKTETSYVDLLKHRAGYRKLLAKKDFLEKLNELVYRLVDAGEIPATSAEAAAALLAENDAELAESRSEQSETAEKIYNASGLDGTAGPDAIADTLLPDPRRLSLPLNDVIDTSISHSFERIELSARLEAAESRVRREQWLEWENPNPNPHPNQDHAVKIAIAEANNISLQIDNLINQIAAEATTLVSIHSNDETRFTASKASLNLLIKVYGDAESAFINGEHDFNELVEKVIEILDARHHLDLVKISYLSARAKLDRLRLSGVYQWLSFDWRDHP